MNSSEHSEQARCKCQWNGLKWNVVDWYGMEWSGAKWGVIDWSYSRIQCIQ